MKDKADGKAEEFSAEALKSLMEGIIGVAEKERKASASYKLLFKRSNSMEGLLRNLEDEMTGHALNATTVLKEKYGYEKVSDEAYILLLALPFLEYNLVRYIQKTEGPSCCVDKAYYILEKAITQALVGEEYVKD